MSKIAFIVPYYNYQFKHGGATKAYVDLAKILQETGHKIEILTPLNEEFKSCYNPFIKETKISKKNEGLEIKVFETKWYRNIPNIIFRLVFKIKPFFYPFNFLNANLAYIGPYFKKVEKYIIENNFDAVFINCLPYYYTIEIPKNLKKIGFKGKLILSPFVHTDKIDYLNPVFQKCFEYYDHIHTVSKFEKNFLIKNFGIQKNKVEVLPLFLDDKEYVKINELSTEINEFKKMHKIENQKVILGIFSESKNSKGMEKTIEAFNKLNLSDTTLILIGDSKEIPTKLGKNVINLGKVLGRKKHVVFASCDVFCMPSNSDSFGLVYLEAWMYKKPIVLLDLPVMRELFDGGGLFAEEGNINSLKKCLKELLQNEKLRKEIGEKGYRILNERYLLKHLHNKYIKLTYND